MIVAALIIEFIIQLVVVGFLQLVLAACGLRPTPAAIWAGVAWVALLIVAAVAIGGVAMSIPTAGVAGIVIAVGTMLYGRHA